MATPIIPILTSTFSNIQFFIATHSPQIVGSVNSDSVFICDDFNVHKVNMKTKGEDTNSLLKFIFNATERPKPYVELLEKFYTLMEENNEYSEIKKLIEQVRRIEEEDESKSISNLVDEMNLQLEAYKFEREHEKNN